jgi:hypothetical protein
MSRNIKFAEAGDPEVPEFVVAVVHVPSPAEGRVNVSDMKQRLL